MMLFLGHYYAFARWYYLQFNLGSNGVLAVFQVSDSFFFSRNVLCIPKNVLTLHDNIQLTANIHYSYTYGKRTEQAGAAADRAEP